MNNYLTEYETQKPAAAKAVALLFGGVLLLISAATSMAFFSEYAPALFSFVSPELSPYLSALVGALVFEGASVVWSWLRSHDSDTATQLSVASTGAWSAMAGGLLVTACYFLLNVTLLAERLDTTAQTTISLLSGLLIIVGVALNFCLAHIYRTNSEAQQHAGQNAELRAMSASARHTVLRESTSAKLSQTIENIRHQLPDHARVQGQHDAGEYLARAFTQATSAQRSPSLPAQDQDVEDLEPVPFLSANGRPAK